MKAKNLRLNADELVHLVTARIDEIKGELCFVERATLRSLAIDLAIRFGASTEIHDELIDSVLKSDPLRGVDCAILLAPRASMKRKDKVLASMFLPFRCKDVSRVIDYVKDVLGRDLTLAECEKIVRWFSTCTTTSDEKGRQKIVDYIEKKYPEKLHSVTEYFRNEDRFWDGVGSIL